jgi:hypothetical protein
MKRYIAAYIDRNAEFHYICKEGITCKKEYAMIFDDDKEARESIFKDGRNINCVAWFVFEQINEHIWSVKDRVA